MSIASSAGKSAYQIAVANGYSGTEAEWLASLHGASASNGGTYLVSGGGVSWVSDFQYRSSVASYFIAGVYYTATEQTVTLSAAHATLNRIDTIVLNASGTLSAIAGTAAANPIAAEPDPATYVKLAQIFVTANTTSPTITNTSIYAENVEWTISASSGTIVSNSTTSPRSGTKSIDGTSVASNTTLTATAASAQDINANGNLVFFIKLKATWSGKKIFLQFLNGSTAIGKNVAVQSGQYGFDTAYTAGYQQIVIPIAHFAIPAGYTATKLQFLFGWSGGGTVGFYIDDVFMQSSIPGGEVPVYSEDLLQPAIASNVLTLDCGNKQSRSFYIDWNANITTLSIINVPTTGPAHYKVTLKQDATGGRTLSVPAWILQMGAAFSPNTTASKKTSLALVSLDYGASGKFEGFMAAEQ